MASGRPRAAITPTVRVSPFGNTHAYDPGSGPQSRWTRSVHCLAERAGLQLDLEAEVDAGELGRRPPWRACSTSRPRRSRTRAVIGPSSVSRTTCSGPSVTSSTRHGARTSAPGLDGPVEQPLVELGAGGHRQARPVAGRGSGAARPQRQGERRAGDRRPRRRAGRAGRQCSARSARRRRSCSAGTPRGRAVRRGPRPAAAARAAELPAGPAPTTATSYSSTVPTLAASRPGSGRDPVHGTAPPFMGSARRRARHRWRRRAARPARPAPPRCGCAWRAGHGHRDDLVASTVVTVSSDLEADPEDPGDRAGELAAADRLQRDLDVVRTHDPAAERGDLAEEAHDEVVGRLVVELRPASRSARPGPR